jgi:hypothetical protein
MTLTLSQEHPVEMLPVRVVPLTRGRFTTVQDVTRAYDEAARILHGEYGRYNFPQPGEQPAVQKDYPRLPPETSR